MTHGATNAVARLLIELILEKRFFHKRKLVRADNLVVAATLFGTEHVHTASKVHLDFFFLLLFLYYDSSRTSVSATAATSTASGRRDSNEFTDLLGVGEAVGKDNGVEGSNFSVASGLEEGSDLVARDIGLYGLGTKKEKCELTCLHSFHKQKRSNGLNSL